MAKDCIAVTEQEADRDGMTAIYARGLPWDIVLSEMEWQCAHSDVAWKSAFLEPLGTIAKHGDPVPGQQPRMRTRTVRIYERDVDRIRELTGLGDAGPFATARFVPFRFTAASRDFLVDNARFLVEKELVELPIEPDEVRRKFLDVQATEDGYEHASRKLKDLFDAMALALSEARDGGSGRSMGILAARQRPATGLPSSHRARGLR